MNGIFRRRDNWIYIYFSFKINNCLTADSPLNWLFAFRICVPVVADACKIYAAYIFARHSKSHTHTQSKRERESKSVFLLPKYCTSLFLVFNFGDFKQGHRIKTALCVKAESNECTQQSHTILNAESDVLCQVWHVAWLQGTDDMSHVVCCTMFEQCHDLLSTIDWAEIYAMLWCRNDWIVAILFQLNLFEY